MKWFFRNESQNKDSMEANFYCFIFDKDVNTKSVTNNEAVQLTKQRQERAKELFSQKKIKEEKDRQRYVLLPFFFFFFFSGNAFPQ